MTLNLVKVRGGDPSGTNTLNEENPDGLGRCANASLNLEARVAATLHSQRRDLLSFHSEHSLDCLLPSTTRCGQIINMEGDLFPRLSDGPPGLTDTRFDPARSGRHWESTVR
ncbi:hypothetical protein GCM10022198_20420 [Klugiella xanthotipulae]